MGRFQLTNWAAEPILLPAQDRVLCPQLRRCTSLSLSFTLTMDFWRIQRRDENSFQRTKKQNILLRDLRQSQSLLGMRCLCQVWQRGSKQCTEQLFFVCLNCWSAGQIEREGLLPLIKQWGISVGEIVTETVSVKFIVSKPK